MLRLLSCLVLGDADPRFPEENRDFHNLEKQRPEFSREIGTLAHICAKVPISRENRGFRATGKRKIAFFSEKSYFCIPRPCRCRSCSCRSPGACCHLQNKTFRST